MATMKTLTINGVTYNVSPVVPVSSVTLFASAWEGSGDAYSQVVEIPEVTPYTKVDLQPTSEQLEEFHYKVLAFVAENEGGVVTVYAIGDKPRDNHTIQITKTEVDATGKIRGNTVGTSMPRSDWNQTDPNKADYIHNKPVIIKSVNGATPDENGNVEVEGGSGGSGGFVASDTQPENTSQLWIDTSDNSVEVEIPEALPNPHTLTFTGAVSATYDGSKAVSIEIPSGGGSGGSGGASGWQPIDTIDLSSGALSYEFDTAGYTELMLVNKTAVNCSGSVVNWKSASSPLTGGNLAINKVIGTVFMLHYLGNGTIAYSNGRQSDTLLMAGAVNVNESTLNNILRLTFTSVTSGTIFIAGRA